MNREPRSAGSKRSQLDPVPEYEHESQFPSPDDDLSPGLPAPISNSAANIDPSTAATSDTLRLPLNWFLNPSTRLHFTGTPGLQSSISNLTGFRDGGEVIEHPTSFFLESDGTNSEVITNQSGNEFRNDNSATVHATRNSRAPSSNYSDIGDTNELQAVESYLDTVTLPEARKAHYTQIKSAPLIMSSYVPDSEGQRNMKGSLLDSTACIPASNPGTSYLEPHDYRLPNNEGGQSSSKAICDSPSRDSQLEDSPIFKPDLWDALNPENERQKLQDTLLRNNSFRSQPDLELIKVNLSRSRSAYSKKNQNLQDSPPLLFSQGKPVSRSRSLKKGSHSQVDADVSLIDEEQFSPRDLPLPESTEDVEANDGIDEVEQHPQNESESNQQSEDDVASDIYYNPITQETELNALNSSRRKANSRLFGLSPPFKAFYKAENPNLNKPIGNSGKGFWNKKSPSSTSKVKRSKGDKNKYIVIWVLFVLLMASICTMVPLLIIFSRGTDGIVTSYLNNISPQHRESLLEEFADGKDTQITRSQLKGVGLSNQTSLVNEVANSDSALSIAGTSDFHSIPLKYQKNSEIKAVMNNPSLRNIFYGVDYAPNNVIYPMCGVSLHDVMLDVALLSQITSRIRTYGTQCNQARYILESIKTLNLNVSLALGVWIGPNEDINRQQLNEMKDILHQYPREYFESVYVGNEVLFREDQTPDGLASYIKEVKSFVQQDLKWNVLVGTSELGSRADSKIMEVSDIFGSNTHPFFNGDKVQTAPKWVFDFVKYQVEPVKEQSRNKPEIVISEVGWPYGGGKYNEAVAGKRQFDYFLNSWICDSKNETYPWYYFEAFDEPWKEVYHRDGAKWETEWGIFNRERNLKEGIVFPTC